MDDDTSPARSLPRPRGGVVEPANRAGVAKERFQTPNDPPTERYEFRDPFAEVTYRANTFPEIVAKADQVQSLRITAIDEHGARTTILKVNGEWKRDAVQRAPRPATPDQAIDSPDKPGRAAEPADASSTPIRAATPEAVVAKSIAKVDAQAERAAEAARIEAALVERYVIKRAPVTVGTVSVGQTEYRFRGDTSRVAFTESTFRLATDINSPSVARSMVDVAQARNWQTLRVSGNDDFRRLVWLEASARGVKTLGYEPVPADLEVLARAREARLINRIEPMHSAEAAATALAPAKTSARGGGGRKAVLAAIEAVLVARQVPEKKREAVMAAATEQLAQRLREGQNLKVKVYDKAAPSHRPVVVPKPEVQRMRERAAPVR